MAEKAGRTVLERGALVLARLDVAHDLLELGRVDLQVPAHHTVSGEPCRSHCGHGRAPPACKAVRQQNEVCKLTINEQVGLGCSNSQRVKGRRASSQQASLRMQNKRN